MLMWFVLQGTSHAADYVRVCSVISSEIIPVVFDKDRGEYVVVDVPEMDDGKNKTRSRNLRSWDAVVPAVSISSHRRVQDNVSDDVLFVRECQCSFRTNEDKYCPFDKTACGIPRDPTGAVGCFNQSSRTALIRNAWPVVILWYGGLVIFLLFTEQGRSTRHFVWQKCCNRNLNNQLVDQYWYIEGGFWRRRQRRRPITNLLQDVRQRARERNQEVPPLPQSAVDHLVDSQHPPNELALKTRRYVAPPNVHPQDDDDDMACAICFSPLEDGDRVGALPCDHTFHVDCLKTWLPRRNVCPLCQAPDVAAPRYRPQAAEEEEDLQTTDEGQAQESSESDLAGTPPSEPQQERARRVDAFRGLTILHRR